MKSIAYVCLVLSMFSCVSRNTQQEKMTLLAATDSLSVEVGTPTLIKQAGRRLFVNHSMSDEGMIDVIDINGDSVAYSFAVRGQGPDEFLQIASMDVVERGGDAYFTVFDNLKREYVTWSIDSLDATKGRCRPVSRKSLPPSSRYLEVYELDGMYVATGRTAKKFSLLDPQDMHRLRSCCDYLSGGFEDTDSMTLSKANVGRQYVSSRRDRMAGVVFMGGTLSVYAVADDSLRTEWTYTCSPFAYSKDGSSLHFESPVGYLAAGFLDDGVVALYCGEVKKDGSNYGKELHLFDRKGVLKKRLRLDADLYNFVIDTAGSYIYAIAYSPDPKLLIYRI